MAIQVTGKESLFSLGTVGTGGTGTPAANGRVVRIYAFYTHGSLVKFGVVRRFGEWMTEHALFTHLSFCKTVWNFG